MYVRHGAFDQDPGKLLRHLREQRVLTDFDDDSDEQRNLIARHVLAVVAMFAGNTELAERAADDNLEVTPGEPTHMSAEQHVRTLAAAAEGATVYLTGRAGGEVLYQVLGDEELLDDYLRMVRIEQHMAFGHERTTSEADAHRTHLHDVARLADEQRASYAEHVRNGERLCVCGVSAAAHAAREWRFDAPCWSFRPLAQAQLSQVAVKHLSAAVDVDVKHRGLSVDPAARRAAVKTLELIRTNSATTPAGQAIAAVLTAVKAAPTT